MKKLISVFAFVILFSQLRNGFARPESIQLTVYNQGIALVREVRKISLDNGTNSLKVQDVPALIDPTSVYFKSILHPDQVRILEQNYDYDLVSQGKLWNKYLGKEVDVEIVDPLTHQTILKKAKLLSTGWSYSDGGWSETGKPILEMEGKVYIDPPGRIIFPALSASSFLLRPTLSWLVQSQVTGNENVELSYITSGLSWKANYVVVTDSSDAHLDLTGWVTLDNKSGTAFHDARLQLMAGDVHLVRNEAPVYALMKSAAPAGEGGGQFQEKPFFEYHLYTLNRPATVLNDQTKQIELLSGHNVQMQKVFVYDGSPAFMGYFDNESYRESPTIGPQSNKKVWVMLEFFNSKENGLGLPLPKGIVRVYKTDDNGAREFIGEDQIDHTPKDEKIRLYLGDAFDVVGERKQTSFKEVIPHHVYEESTQIQLKNHKDQGAKVQVIEHVWRWNDWTITQSSHKFQKLNSHTIEFPIEVPSNGKTTITYTVRYKW